VQVGTTERLVAHCKLQALLAQFDRGKDLPAADAAGRAFVSEPKLNVASSVDSKHTVRKGGSESSSKKSKMARQDFFYILIKEIGIKSVTNIRLS
jgi:hypothetical protein